MPNDSQKRERRWVIVYKDGKTTTTLTYGHRSQRTDHPVRSGVLKLRTGGLVVRWVTTCESPLLYVLLLPCYIVLTLPRGHNRQPRSIP